MQNKKYSFSKYLNPTPGESSYTINVPSLRARIGTGWSRKASCLEFAAVKLGRELSGVQFDSVPLKLHVKIKGGTCTPLTSSNCKFLFAIFAAALFRQLKEGTNTLGIRGTSSILQDLNIQFLLFSNLRRNRVFLKVEWRHSILCLVWMYLLFF